METLTLKENLLISKFEKWETSLSSLLDSYVKHPHDKEIINKIKEIKHDRYELVKKLQRLYPPPNDSVVDYVHDSVLCNGEDMPKGHLATVVGVYYEPIYRKYEVIAKVKPPKGAEYIITVITPDKHKIGTIYISQH